MKILGKEITTTSQQMCHGEKWIQNVSQNRNRNLPLKKTSLTWWKIVSFCFLCVSLFEPSVPLLPPFFPFFLSKAFEKVLKWNFKAPIKYTAMPDQPSGSESCLNPTEYFFMLTRKESATWVQIQAIYSCHIGGDPDPGHICEDLDPGHICGSGSRPYMCGSGSRP